MNKEFSVLFRTIEIGRGNRKLVLKNRFVMPAMCPLYASNAGEVTQKQIDYYAERAKGGVALIIVETMDVKDHMLVNRLGVFHDRFINGLNELSTRIKENGAKVFGQLNETGIRGNFEGPDDLTEAEIEKIIQLFGEGAERVKKAEFDGVEIHGAHGYLISQFLSALTNHRVDQYGGNGEKRTAFAEKVIRSVRKAVGSEFPISFRLNGNDFLKGGTTIEDAKVMARKAEEAGADLIHVSAGVGINPHDISLGDNKSYSYMVQPMALPRGCLVNLAGDIKNVVKVPVIAVGRINDPFLANDILVQGKADLIALGRQLIADPYFPDKVAKNRLGEIRNCIACNYCHGKRVRAIKHMNCTVNPLVGREGDLRWLRSASISKRIMIVGGGPAGMEAARWLKKRGHQPVVYEKSDRLGGQLLLAHLAPHKEEISSFLQFLVRELGKLEIPINLMTAVTPEFVLEKRPDVLIIATGGKQMKPSMAMSDKMKCFYAWDIISGKENVPKGKIAILGGGFVAAETAELIAGKSKDTHITIIEMRGLIAAEMEPTSRQLLIDRLNEFGVKMLTNTLIEEVTDRGVKLRILESDSRKELPVDAIVVGLGSEPVAFAVQDIERSGIHVQFVGDANEVRGIADAVREGYLIGTSI